MSHKKFDCINISSYDAGIRLDKFIIKKYPCLNNAKVNKLIRKKDIKVNGNKAVANYKLCLGDKISIAVFLFTKENMEVQKQSFNKSLSQELLTKRYQYKINQIKHSVIFKNNDFLILNKPSEVAVQGGSGVNFHLGICLPSLRFENENNPLFVHRIDKSTSGILILARNRLASEHMYNLFKDKKVNKIYYALVHGKVHGVKGEINYPIKKFHLSSNAQYFDISQDGKEAITHFELLGYNSDFNISFLKLVPITGRTHQLRIHLSKVMKTPIIGDFKYNFEYQNTFSVLQSLKKKKLYLHAKEISFNDAKNNQINVNADFDNDFNSLIKELNFRF